MPLVSLATLVDEARGLDVLGGSFAPVMVEVDEERLKVLARGARCVSLSSAACEQAAGQLI